MHSSSLLKPYFSITHSETWPPAFSHAKISRGLWKCGNPTSFSAASDFFFTFKLLVFSPTKGFIQVSHICLSTTKKPVTRFVLKILYNQFCYITIKHYSLWPSGWLKFTLWREGVLPYSIGCSPWPHCLFCSVCDNSFPVKLLSPRSLSYNHVIQPLYFPGTSHTPQP